MSQYDCSIQSCLFVQSWPRYFLGQCRENLCNAGAAFAATGYYQKINRFKIKFAEKWCYSDDIGFFPVQCCLESLGQHCTEFLLCNVVPRVLRHYWTGFFHVKCFLEVLGQHYTRFLPVQCCPKAIKTILNRIYSWVMFSGGSWSTLHKVFTFAMLTHG